MFIISSLNVLKNSFQQSYKSIISNISALEATIFLLGSTNYFNNTKNIYIVIR